MSIGPYIDFNGNCREAIEFYTDVFKAENVTVMTYGDMPQGAENMPEEEKKRVMHASMSIAGGYLMMADTDSNMPVKVGNNVSILVMLDSADQIKAIYEKLKAGSQILMELQETFFSKSYAYLIDKFGVGWQLYLQNM